jgi:hypothetical protein
MRAIGCLLVAVALAGGCGAIKDPYPDEVDHDLTIRAGDVKERRVCLEEPDWWDDDPPDHDFWDWDEHVRDLPPGFDYDTLDVDEYDGELSIVYELRVARWVEPGDYDFEVTYEFWPYVDPIRDAYEIEFDVRVKRPRDEHVDAGHDKYVVRQVLPRGVTEPRILNFFRIGD